MTERRDKLGRRIPVFDRSAANKKAAQTRKENHGEDDHARAGAAGGRKRSSSKGFGKLKAENPEKFQEIVRKGGQSGEKYFSKLKRENPEALKAISADAGHKSGGKRTSVRAKR